MEKVAWSEKEGDIGGAYPVTPFVLRFTEPEKDHLREVLKKYDQTSVEEYIPCLEVQCRGFANVLANPKKHDHRKNKEDMLKNLKVTLRRLKSLSLGKSYIHLPYDILEIMDQDNLLEMGTFTREVQQAAQQAVGPIERLIKILEENLDSEKKEKPGRPTCDTTAGFVQIIAESFASYFEVNNITAHKSGPFASIVSVVFEALNSAIGTNLPVEDPSRPIAKALKAPRDYTF